jgi:hypothetical protein
MSSSNIIGSVPCSAADRVGARALLQRIG